MGHLGWSLNWMSLRVGDLCARGKGVVWRLDASPMVDEVGMESKGNSLALHG